MMHKHSQHGALLISAILTISLAPAMALGQETAPVVAFDADDTTGQVRELFREGTAKMVAGDLESAHKTLLQIWSIRQTADVAGALGQVELATRRFRDAAEHFDWCLNHFPPVESEKVLLATRALFKQAKRHVAQLELSTNRDGADLRIDGRSVGTSPLSSSLFLEPGKHEIDGSLGNLRQGRVIIAAKGTQYAVNLTFVGGVLTAVSDRAAGPAVSVAATSTESAPTLEGNHDRAKRSIVPVIVGGAIFAVGLGTGIGLRLYANSKYDDAEAIQRDVGPSGCADATRLQAPCSALKSAVDKGDRSQNWSTVGFLAAGVALIATPVYWFWPQNKQKNAAYRALQHMSASFTPQYSSLSLSGEF